MRGLIVAISLIIGLVGSADARHVKSPIVGASQEQMLAMMAPITFDTLHSAVSSYTGPCDVSLSGSCAEAYSVSRAMTSSYSGALFQVYNGTTTTDIGQVNHVANTAALLTACAASTTCVISKVYGQINGNNLRPTLTTDGGLAPSACSSTYACAPPVIIDPNNGLPVVVTPYPTEMYFGNGAPTGITAGTGPISVFAYTHNAGWSNCCGFFGIAHAINAATTAGTDFLPGLTYSNGHTYSNCSTSTTVCANVDIEIDMTNGADYSPNSLQYVSYLATAAGGAGNVGVYINSATPIYTGAAATSLNVGTQPRIGAGGDGSHVFSVFQEGIIANAALNASDYTALSSNVSTFYSGRSKDACSGTGDVTYHFDTGAGGQGADASSLATLVGYGLRRLRASYYGPIADLRDSAGTVHTYGPASSGCGIDTAAATFCAANAPCTVAKLYNQGTLSTANVGNAHDTTLDLVQATTASQPQANFTGLNGYPTMVFSGAQYLCSGTPGSNAGFITAWGVVAKRTSFTTYSTVLTAGGADQSMGFNNTSGAIYGNTGTLINGGSYAESHWHSIVVEQTGTAAGQYKLYGDNSVAASSTSSVFKPINNAAPVCIGADDNAGTIQFYLTGEIAEAMALGVSAPGGGATTERSPIFTAQQSAWGTLPN